MAQYDVFARYAFVGSKGVQFVPWQYLYTDLCGIK